MVNQTKVNVNRIDELKQFVDDEIIEKMATGGITPEDIKNYVKDAIDDALEEEIGSTLVTRTGDQTITNKTISGTDNTIFDIPYSVITGTPPIGKGTITLKKNDTIIDSFALNDDENKSINIEVPTTVAELNDSNNYVTTDTQQTINGNKTFNGNQGVKIDTTSGSALTITNPNNTSTSMMLRSDGNIAGRTSIISVDKNNDNAWKGRIEFDINNETRKSTVNITGDNIVLTSVNSTLSVNPNNSDNSKKIATTSWVKNQNYISEHQSLDNYVTLNTQQTITSQKIFNAQPQFAAGQGIRFNTSKGNNEFWTIRSAGSNPSAGCSLLLNNDASGSTHAWQATPEKMIIGSDVILPYAGSSPSASDSSTRIATTSWVNTIGNNVVHLSGTEQINGAKTFTSKVTINGPKTSTIIIKNTDVDKETTTSSVASNVISGLDNTGKSTWLLQHRWADNTTTNLKSNQIRLYCFKGDTSNTSTCLAVGFNENGKAYTYAPTPILTSTDAGYAGQIVNVTYLNSSASNVVHRTGNETIAGEKTFSDAVTTSGTINSSKTTSTYLAGNQGNAIINSTAAGGKNSYTMLAKMNSTNGYFTTGTYGQKFLLQYTSKEKVTAETNNVDKSVTLLDEDGNTTLAVTPATNDNSNKAATTAFVKACIDEYLNKVYPKNSVYITTSSSNPNSILGFGTWELIGSSIITSVNESVPIKGNGKAIGVQVSRAVTVGNGTSGALSAHGDYGSVAVRKDDYTWKEGTATGSIAKASSGAAIRLVTNASNSGIVGTVTRTSISVNIWKRTN